MDAIRGRIEVVRRRIAAACDRAGRDPSTVLLVGVTKTHPPGTVIAAVQAGLVDLGENYAKELSEKARALPAGVEPRWHFIGALQSNKVRLVAPLLCAVHSVDRPSLVEELSRRLPAGRILDVFIEVSIAGEAQKSGARPEMVEDLCRLVLGAPGLRLAGLMCVPPLSGDPEASRPYFRALAAMRERLRDRLGPPPGILDGLSMGMSNDLDVAVEEGATVVRVGTAIFGQRPSPGGHGGGM